MSLPLRPEMVVAVYDMLRAFPPFARWALPPGDEVQFTVNKHPSWIGSYSAEPHCIAVSSLCVAHMDTLVRAVAHEMLHLRQYLTRTYGKGQHNAEFRRLAKTVCRLHGWDPKIFV